MLFLILTASCVSAPEKKIPIDKVKDFRPPPDKKTEQQWLFEKDAIQLSIKVDPKLNYYQNASHTLSICMYQLKDPNSFNQLSGNQNGLYQILECNLFDPSVTAFKHLTIQPGENQTLSFDRAEGSKYIAIAAGYFSLEKDRITRLFEIPVDVKHSGLFWKNKYTVPQRLKLELTLGPQQIEKIELIK